MDICEEKPRIPAGATVNSNDPSDPQFEDVWVCPRTRSALTADAQSLRSQEGGHEYPIRHGNPCFLINPPNESQEIIDEQKELNRRTAELGWREAVNELLKDRPSLIKYVIDESRAGFLDLLDLDRSMTALEIGPGMGQFAVPLAQRVGHFYGLEVAEGQTRFCAERCRQEGLTNASFACGGDDCRLPIADATINVVVLNLVFEWCSNPTRDDAAADQAFLLAEIFRVLKPGGTLYLTTKNRFALFYLLGKPDEHSYEMRFGNALPRFLHRWLLRRKGHRRTGGLLHSHNRLRDMIAKEGFGDIQSFWAAPEMRFPTHYVPTDAASIRAARNEPDFCQGAYRSTRVLMSMIPAGFVKHFTRGLAFLARKD